MQFNELFERLDRTTRNLEKQVALRDFFLGASPADAAWGLYFLLGNKLKRPVNTPRLREWVATGLGLPLWLVEECYDNVGDLAETLALLWPEPENPVRMSLTEMVESRVLGFGVLTEDEKRAEFLSTLGALSMRDRFLWLKLITGSFRVGVATGFVARAMAVAFALPQDVIAHRLMGGFSPTPEAFERLVSSQARESEAGALPLIPDFGIRPYPFFLAHPVEDEPSFLGAAADWRAEWKWDGIRGQILNRTGAGVAVWSRGEELMTERFPELAALAARLPEGTVLDGEILAWAGGRPLPFCDLQKRIGRKSVDLRKVAPVTYLAYDLLEENGQDLRALSYDARRARLCSLIAGQGLATVPELRLSPLVPFTTWDDLRALFTECRARGVEGFMLKRGESPYGVGRPRGDWWKWKQEPFVLDMVLLYAQKGHGRRSTLFTDYTLAVWKGGVLVPVTKAYSGLTDEEIAKVDSYIRAHTLERFGPVRVVKPDLVLEIAFEGLQASGRHKSGVALRFPRIRRLRSDKPASEANTLEDVQSLLAATAAASGLPRREGKEHRHGTVETPDVLFN